MQIAVARLQTALATGAPWRHGHLTEELYWGVAMPGSALDDSPGAVRVRRSRPFSLCPAPARIIIRCPGPVFRIPHSAFHIPRLDVCTSHSRAIGGLAGIATAQIGDLVGPSTAVLTTVSQIGLIMLIGLAAKNAILIIAFAKAAYEKGNKSIEDAAVDTAHIRLRPILMTSFAFILGCMPLWFASGSGAVARQTSGAVVIGGMLGATFVDTFIVPVTFSIVEKFVAHRRKKMPKAIPQPEIAPEPNG